MRQRKRKCNHKWVDLEKTRLSGPKIAKCPRCGYIVTKGKRTPPRGFGKGKAIWTD